MDIEAMDAHVFEYVLNAYSVTSNLLHIGNIAPTLALVYLAFLLAYALGWIKLQRPNLNMTHSPLTIFNLFIFITLRLSSYSYAQTTAAGGADGLASVSSSPTVTAAASSVEINGTPTSYREIFTYVIVPSFGSSKVPDASLGFGTLSVCGELVKTQPSSILEGKIN